MVRSTLTAPNQSAWLAAMRKPIAEKHPGIKIIDVKPSQEDQQLAFQQTQDLLKSRPDLKGSFAITTAALPGAAEAVKQMGLTGKIAVVGNSTPNAIRDYLKGGQIKSAVLWDPVADGYLTVYTAHELATPPPDSPPTGSLRPDTWVNSNRSRRIRDWKFSSARPSSSPRTTSTTTTSERGPTDMAKAPAGPASEPPRPGIVRKS